MTINKHIANLQAVAATMPGGGENEIEIMVTRQISDSQLREEFWEVIDVFAQKSKDGWSALVRANR